MSRHWRFLQDALVALVAWIVIAVSIVAAGISPVLAALAASVVDFDVAYYNHPSGRDSAASRG